MDSELEQPRPLHSDEIREGIAFLVAEQVYEKLGKTCNLFGQAYPKFKAKWSLDIVFDDFGIITSDHSEGAVETTDKEHDGAPVLGSIPASQVEAGSENTLRIAGGIEEMPPNKFRETTEQPIHVTATENGQPVQRRVQYKSKAKASRAAKKVSAKARAAAGREE